MESARRVTFASQARPYPNSATRVTIVRRYAKPFRVNQYYTDDGGRTRVQFVHA